MVPHTGSKPERKRSSPKPNPSSDDEVARAKRHRSCDDDAGDHEEDDDDDLQVIDAPMANRHKNEAGRPAEAGVILMISVENFMCHKKFTIDLCRNINFIYGQNGSGKSAILAAIQICLGAGARRTRRARNLKELVRKGSNCCSAKIRVTLLNKGDDAYHHEEYGDTITVERTIAVHGGYNGYKLYGDEYYQSMIKRKGQGSNFVVQPPTEISRNKKDLDDMLDKLNIQVENPVAILDQEEAKKFLTGKEEEKYAFFMKATELERLDRNYASIIDKIKDLDNQSSRLDETLDIYTDQVTEAKKRYEDHQTVDKLQRKSQYYEEMLAWAAYKEARELVEGKAKERDKFREKAKKKLKELTQAEEAANTQDDEEIGKRNRLDELTQEAGEESTRKQSLEVELKRAMEPYKALERQLKFLKKEQSSADKSLQNAHKVLEEKRQEIVERAGSAESEEAQRTQRLKEVEAQMAELREKQKRIQGEIELAYQNYYELESQVLQAKDESESAERRYGNIQKRIKDIQASKNDSLSNFGPKCALVRKWVEQERRFQGPVLGPIGSHVKIAAGKESFAKIAELALGYKVLDRFIVTNDHDRHLLQKLRQKAGCREGDCGIFQVHQHPRYNIPAPPGNGIETVASVLHVADDLVFNCLVDTCKIEEKALSISKVESERVLLSKGNNGKYAIKAKAIRQVFFLPQGDSWSVTSGMPSIISNEKRLKQTIGVDKTAMLADADQEACHLKELMDQKRNEFHRLDHEHSKYQKTWNNKKKELRSNEKTMDKVSEKIDQIKDEALSAANFDTDTSEYEQAVSEEEQIVEELKEREASIKEELNEKKPQIEDIKARVREVTDRNEKVLTDMRVAEGDLAQHIQNLSQRQEKIEKKREKIKQYEDIVERGNQQLDSLEEDAKTTLVRAKRFKFNRLQEEKKRVKNEGDDDDILDITQEPSKEDLEIIEIEDAKKDQGFYIGRIKLAERRIQEEKERRNTMDETRVEAYEKFVRAKEQLASKLQQKEEIDATSEKLKIDITRRQRLWKQFRQHIAHTTAQRFDEILNSKGSSGTIEFDHPLGQLHLCVQIDSMDANSQQNDLKALSGGEKSFTNIALLLGLGESLETPFRVLDEFDVFLDPVSRKLAIEHLIKIAKKMKHRQFIFITPQDVSNVESEPGVLRVHKMSPPARIQVAGAAVQQTLEFSQSQS